VHCCTAQATYPQARRDASSLAYSVLLRVEVTVPFALPRTRCALTAPFHPYLIRRGSLAQTARALARPLSHSRETSRRLRAASQAAIGGSFSVALFLASRRTGVTRHPTLWSPDFPLCPARTGCPLRFVPHTATVWPASPSILTCGPRLTGARLLQRRWWRPAPAACTARTAASRRCR